MSDCANSIIFCSYLIANLCKDISEVNWIANFIFLKVNYNFQKQTMRMIEMYSFYNFSLILSFQEWKLYRDRLVNERKKRIFNFMQIMGRLKVRLCNGCFSISFFYFSFSHGLRGGEWSDDEGKQPTKVSKRHFNFILPRHCFKPSNRH